MPDASQLYYLLGREIELEQLKHLRVTVLLHDVDPIVVLYEIVDIVIERISANAQVVRFHPEFFAQLVDRLQQRPVRSAISDDAESRGSVHVSDRCRNSAAGSVKFSGQPI